MSARSARAAKRRSVKRCIGLVVTWAPLRGTDWRDQYRRHLLANPLVYKEPMIGHYFGVSIYGEP